MNAKPKKVLFLDDEPDFLVMVQSVVGSMAGADWQIHTAPNAGDALRIIQEEHIELVVVDLHMPVVDGMQFLSLLNRKHPNLMKAVLTSDLTEEYRAACLSRGAEIFLQKPVDANGWQSVYSTLNELARFKPEEGFRGVLQRVGLHDVLQMECLSQSSAVLEISTKEAQGFVYIEQGQVVHAEVGQRVGTDAFNYLMSLSGGEFTLKPFAQPPQHSITEGWEFLLMEAARKRDEFTATGFREEPDKGAAMAKLSSRTAFLPKIVLPGALDSSKPEIAELLIISSQGDVLYDWKCEHVAQRVNFLEFLSQKSRQLGQGLPLGQFERFEVHGSKSRVVTQIDTDHALFVKANLNGAAQNGGSS
jgi:CheY-like chemotaxis protein